MNRTQIYLPKSQLEELKKKAISERTTVSEVVRQAIAKALFRQTTGTAEGSLESFLEAAKRINAKNKGGPKDLASKVDEYLYGGR